MSFVSGGLAVTEELMRNDCLIGTKKLVKAQGTHLYQ